VRVLLDECLPRRLKRELAGHDARTGPEMGWARKRKGQATVVRGRDAGRLTID